MIVSPQTFQLCVAIQLGPTQGHCNETYFLGVADETSSGGQVDSFIEHAWKEGNPSASLDHESAIDAIISLLQDTRTTIGTVKVTSIPEPHEKPNNVNLTIDVERIESVPVSVRKHVANRGNWKITFC